MACAKNTHLEEAFNEYGEQNMLPRLNTAIKLARKADWPSHFVQRLERIRLELQREGGGLAERRNLFVHGIQAQGPNDGETELTMVRWKGDMRRQVVTLLDAAELSHRLSLLAQEAQSIFDDYGVWKFGIENQARSNQKIAQTRAVSRLIRAENIKRGMKLLFANLKPW